MHRQVDELTKEQIEDIYGPDRNKMNEVNKQKHEVISVIVTTDGAVDDVTNFFLPTNLKDIERDKIIRKAEDYFMERIHDIFGVISLDRSDVLADGLYIDSNENGNVIAVNLVWSVIEIL